MSNTAVGKTHTVTRRFVLLWILSLVIPGLILMALRGLLVADPTWDLGYQFAFMAPLPVWFLIGFLQYWLLQPYRRRSLWWLIATFCGGILGMFVGGPTMIMDDAAERSHCPQQPATPEWMFTPYPLPPAAFAGAVAAAFSDWRRPQASAKAFAAACSGSFSLRSAAPLPRLSAGSPIGPMPMHERDIPRRCRGQHNGAHRDRPLDRHLAGMTSSMAC